MLIFSQKCGDNDKPYDNILTVNDGERWFVAGLSTLNVFLLSDWEFYYGEDVGVNEVGLVAEVWIDIAKQGGRLLDELASILYSVGADVVVIERVHNDENAFALLHDSFLSKDLTAIERTHPHSIFKESCSIFSTTTSRTTAAINATQKLVAHVINLDRRPDRWESISSSPAITSNFFLDRFPAVDGARLDLVNNESIRSLFSLDSWFYGKAEGNPYQDHGYRANVLGCAYSHYLLWKDIAKTPSTDASILHVVFEDDVEVTSHFDQEWPMVKTNLLEDVSWDIFFLGTLDDRNIYDDIVVDGIIMRMSLRPRVFGSGLFAYVLKPSSARKLVAIAEGRGIQQAVDWFVFECVMKGDIVGYKTFPAIMESPEGEGRDSDNDESYNMARLSIESVGKRRGVGVGGGVDVVFDSPKLGESIDHGDTVEIELVMDVNEPANVFSERQKMSRICFSIVPGVSSVVVETDYRRWVAEGEDIGCIAFQEPGLRLSYLSAGEYELTGRFQLYEDKEDELTFQTRFAVKKRCAKIPTRLDIENEVTILEYCTDMVLFDFVKNHCMMITHAVICMSTLTEAIINELGM